MPNLMPEIDIRQDQAEAIAHGLFAVARADGQVHEREAALIREFFASAAGGAANLGALERAPKIEPATLAQQLPTPELRRLFVATALLLAWTDSQLAPGEGKLIDEYATAFGIGQAELSVMQTQVKEYLLSQLAHVQNVQAAVAVAKELKL